MSIAPARCVGSLEAAQNILEAQYEACEGVRIDTSDLKTKKDLSEHAINERLNSIEHNTCACICYFNRFCCCVLLHRCWHPKAEEEDRLADQVYHYSVPLLNSAQSNFLVRCSKVTTTEMNAKNLG